MRAEVSIAGKLYEVNFAEPISIAIPLRANGKGPNCYFTKPLRISPIVTEGFTGSLAAGGTVNHQRIDIAPHGNGTHTECSGHIFNNGHALAAVFRQHLNRALLMTVKPERKNSDMVITRRVFDGIRADNEVNALVIRTLPNSEEKLETNYSGTNPAYISEEAMDLIVALGIEHLVVDLPSVDKESDGGALSAHRCFWKHGDDKRNHCTITELAYIPDFVDDGVYLLDLQTLRIELDASPSNPILYSLSAID